MQTASMISQVIVTGKGTLADQPKLGRGVAGPLTSYLFICVYPIEMHMPMQHRMLWLQAQEWGCKTGCNTVSHLFLAAQAALADTYSRPVHSNTWVAGCV